MLNPLNLKGDAGILIPTISPSVNRWIQTNDLVLMPLVGEKKTQERG
jgi:hypothetical protein